MKFYKKLREYYVLISGICTKQSKYISEFYATNKCIIIALELSYTSILKFFIIYETKDCDTHAFK